MTLDLTKKFFDLTPKAQASKEIDKLDFKFKKKKLYSKPKDIIKNEKYLQNGKKTSKPYI